MRIARYRGFESHLLRHLHIEPASGYRGACSKAGDTGSKLVCGEFDSLRPCILKVSSMTKPSKTDVKWWKAWEGKTIWHDGEISTTDLPLDKYIITNVYYEGPSRGDKPGGPSSWVLVFEGRDGSYYEIGGSQALPLLVR